MYYRVQRGMQVLYSNCPDVCRRPPFCFIDSSRPPHSQYAPQLALSILP